MSQSIPPAARAFQQPSTSTVPSTGQPSQGEADRVFKRSGTAAAPADGNRQGQWMHQHVAAPVRQTRLLFSRSPASAGQAAPQQPPPQQQPPRPQFFSAPLPPYPGLVVGGPPVRLMPPALKTVSWNRSGPIGREVGWPKPLPNPIATPIPVTPTGNEPITYF